MRSMIQDFSSALTLIFAISTAVGVTRAQTLPSDALVATLRQGGNVIVMRHAASPRTVPDAATANPGNTSRERQLDATGRETAKAMGKALRDLKIPIGEVLTSPTYRAHETIKLAEFPNPKDIPQLGEGGANMQPTSGPAVNWLKTQVTKFPTGTNTIMVTHMPNLTQAFPQEAAGVSDGEALIFASDEKGGAKLLGRVKIEQWPGMVPRTP